MRDGTMFQSPHEGIAGVDVATYRDWIHEGLPLVGPSEAGDWRHYSNVPQGPHDRDAVATIEELRETYGETNVTTGNATTDAGAMGIPGMVGVYYR